MKFNLILAGMVAILSLSLPACATSDKIVNVQASYDDFMKSKSLIREINVGVGNIVKITLASNPSTGFKWELADISDMAVLAQEDESEYVASESTAIGAGGHEVWTFKALQKGTSRIALVYSQPWAGGEKAAWTLGISVKVK